MFSKRKCSNCGTQNPKERTTCTECGAPFASRQVEGQVAQVTTEGETQKREGLYKTIEQPTAHKKSAWFWVGVTLLTLSTLYWLTVILTVVDQPEAEGDMVFTGVIFTAIPIGIGIYGIRRGRKPPAVEAQGGPEPVAQPVREARQSTGRKSSAWFWVGITLLCLSAFFWVIVILANIGSGDIGGALLVGVMFTAIPIGIGIYGIRRGRQRRYVMEKITFTESQRVMENITAAAGAPVIASHKIGFRTNIEITDKGLRVKRVNIHYSQIRECMFTRTRGGEVPNRLVIRYSDQTGRHRYVKCGGIMIVQICKDITEIALRYGYRIPQTPDTAITRMADELKAHGIESDLIEPDVKENWLEDEHAPYGQPTTWCWELDMGGLRMRGCNIDTICVLELGRGSPYAGDSERDNFLYHTDCQLDIEPVPKAMCHGRPIKRYRIWIVGYKWKGSKLAPRLNDDDELVQMLVKAKAPEIEVEGNKISFQDKKLRTVKLFWCIDRIALHLREYQKAIQ